MGKNKQIKQNCDLGFACVNSDFAVDILTRPSYSTSATTNQIGRTALKAPTSR